MIGIFLLITNLGLKSDNLLAMPVTTGYLISAEPDSIYDEPSPDKTTILLEWLAGTAWGASAFYLLMPKEEDSWEALGIIIKSTIPVSILACCAGVHAVGTWRQKRGNILYSLLGECLGLGFSMIILKGLPEKNRDKLFNTYPILGAIMIFEIGSLGATIGYNWKWKRTKE